MRFGVLGAGGVGGYYGGVLARAGHDVVLHARGAHLEAIAARGLEVRTPSETFVAPVAVSGDVGALEGVEVLFVAVKGYALAEVTPAVARVAERGATVVPLLNGVEAADRLIAGGVPEAAVLGGLTEISAERAAPGVIVRHSSFQRVVVGERRGGSSERAERIAAALRETGVDAKVATDLDAELWRKLAFISTMAAACGLARAPIGPVRDAPHGRLLVERLVEEALAVGRARGVQLAPDLGEKLLRAIDGLPAAMRPSFLLDLERGGPTELDALSGAVSRLGRAAGVPTPIHDVATAALSVLPKQG